MKTEETMKDGAGDAGARADRLFEIWWNAALGVALLATLAGCWLFPRASVMRFLQERCNRS